MEHDLVVNPDGRKIGQLSGPQAGRKLPMVDKLQRIVLQTQAIAIDSIRPEANYAT
jgi:hypothetical protein